jgi:histidine triad (HIT) family protein
MPESCIFCRIVAGAEPSWQVYQNEHAYAFLDRFPATPGHTLVVPRTHATDIWDISREDAGHLMETVHDVAALLDERLQPAGMTLFQANRTAGWQDVFHMHIHLVPRYTDDTLRRSWVPQSVTGQDLDKVHSRLRQLPAGERTVP